MLAVDFLTPLGDITSQQTSCSSGPYRPSAPQPPSTVISDGPGIVLLMDLSLCILIDCGFLSWPLPFADRRFLGEGGHCLTCGREDYMFRAV